MNSIFSFLLLLYGIQIPDANVEVVLMKSVQGGVGSTTPTYEQIEDVEVTDRYKLFLRTECGRLALHLYSKACEETLLISRKNRYFILLDSGENDVGLGFVLKSKTGSEDYLRTPYVRLDPREAAFKVNVLHETGHVILMLLNGHRQIPKRTIASIPHSTAALTDRGTAFDEGFCIHLETLAAHYFGDALVAERYHHKRFVVGAGKKDNCLNWHVTDLLSFSQSHTRYYDVVENSFAFTAAYKGADYLRVQLEKSRDYSQLRDANQLLQSEGFYASFFFYLVMTEDSVVGFDGALEREYELLSQLYKTLNSTIDSEAPVMLKLVENVVVDQSPLADRWVAVLTELSHGVFVDDEATAMWQMNYMNALTLNTGELNITGYDETALNWGDKVMAAPKLLYTRIGPQIKVDVHKQVISLNGLKVRNELSFDINTAEEGVMKLVPGINDDEVSLWMKERWRKPFESHDDFERRCGVVVSR